MKKRKIPSNMQPWTANINGKEYEYESGTTAEVPDEVAALIDFIDESAPKRDPKAAQRAIEDEVTQIVKDNFAGGVGYEETTEGALLPETSFEVSGGQAILSDSFPCELEADKEYTVTFDGVTNSCTAELFEPLQMVCIISTSAEEIMKGNGWLCYVDNGKLCFMTEDASIIGAHSISISGVGNFTYKIGDKYIDFKMDKTNPVGEGAFSLNRKAGSNTGECSFAEGDNTIASGYASHAEGGLTTASGDHSHAEGIDTTASGDYSHAEGRTTTASGDYSHAEGFWTIAASKYQHVQGEFNVEDSQNVYAHIIGKGSDEIHRKNIHTVDWSGNAWYAGTVEGKTLILASSTAGSTKRFKVTVNDAGTLTATEVTS